MKILKILGLIFLWLIIAFVIAEGICYLLICSYVLKPDLNFFSYNNLYASSRPCAKHDAATGYRYVPGKTKIVNVYDGKLSIDHWMSVNAQGYTSVYDYTLKKDSGETRYMVLGDSYSTGEITDTTWVDMLNLHYSGKETGKKPVFYNFSLEGAGIRNWYLQFKNEIVHYDFDGIVFAVFGDNSYTSYDLCRPLAIRHSFEDVSGFVYTERNVNDLNELKGALMLSDAIYDEAELSIYKDIATNGYDEFRFRLFPLHLYLTEYVKREWSIYKAVKLCFSKFKQQDVEPMIVAGEDCTAYKLEGFLSDENYKMLMEIVNYCIDNSKKIILISIPSLKTISNYPEAYHDNIYNHQLRCFAEQYHANFIDGYSIYDGIPNDSLHLYRIAGDMHWNKKSNVLFADYLTSTGVFDVAKHDSL